VSRQVKWTSRASKDLARLDRQTQRRIVAVVKRFAETGYGDIKRLKGPEEEVYRLRVGDWRVFSSLRDALIVRVQRVHPRSSAYRP
jgi:mRNA interferase RelE/StbE